MRRHLRFVMGVLREGKGFVLVIHESEYRVESRFPHSYPSLSCPAPRLFSGINAYSDPIRVVYTLITCVRRGAWCGWGQRKGDSRDLSQDGGSSTRKASETSLNNVFCEIFHVTPLPLVLIWLLLAILWGCLNADLQSPFLFWLRCSLPLTPRVTEKIF